MTWSKKKKQSYKLGHNRKKIIVLRIYHLKVNGMYTTILWFFMSPGMEVNIPFLIIHKKTFRIRIVSFFPSALS